MKKNNGHQGSQNNNNQSTYRSETNMNNYKKTEGEKGKRKSFAMILITVIVGMIGFSYASVPLYRLFCQATGFGGTTQVAHSIGTTETKEIKDRTLTIRFNADVSDSIPWRFQPAQQEMKVKVGETALAFYRAYNPTNESIVGISTYNVTPQKAGVFFNKIQCFCFEEQRLQPKELVEMPVFFFIDPEMVEDSTMDDVNIITLSYTFFPVNHGISISS